MKFQITQKETTRLKLIFLPIFFLVLFACATVPVKTYEESVSEWKSYKDVAKWMDRYFYYDTKRLLDGLEMYSSGKLLIPRPPEETFELQAGVCHDAAFFAKETLNRINPAYQAEIVFMEFQKDILPCHFVCSFKKNNKMYIMDYGTPTRSVAGVFGPFSSLKRYKEYYEMTHRRKVISSISFGWPRWVVTASWSSVSIRSGAKNTSTIIATVEKGTKLTVVGFNKEWLNVQLENGKEGWVSSDFVKYSQK
jgi:hypothetical protein